MAGSDRVKAAARALWGEQGAENWEALRRALWGSGVVYYKAVYGAKLHKISDLKKAYILLYDGKFKEVTKIPIWEDAGGGITGATKYLIGLKVSNLVD